MGGISVVVLRVKQRTWRRGARERTVLAVPRRLMHWVDARRALLQWFLSIFRHRLDVLDGEEVEEVQEGYQREWRVRAEWELVSYEHLIQ